MIAFLLNVWQDHTRLYKFLALLKRILPRIVPRVSNTKVQEWYQEFQEFSHGETSVLFVAENYKNIQEISVYLSQLETFRVRDCFQDIWI